MGEPESAPAQPRSLKELFDSYKIPNNVRFWLGLMSIGAMQGQLTITPELVLRAYDLAGEPYPPEFTPTGPLERPDYFFQPNNKTPPRS